MQVKSGCMIVSVDKVDEAVDWLEQISLDIGQKPFQFRSLALLSLSLVDYSDASECTDFGNNTISNYSELDKLRFHREKTSKIPTSRCCLL